MTLKRALERLGIGRCYHMHELSRRPEAPGLWIEADAGRPDWARIFNGFSATADWPSAKFFRELAAAYPEAKVIHTERDPDEWFDSIRSTIFGGVLDRAPAGAWRDMVERVVLSQFEGRHMDRGQAISVFKRHNEAVRRAIAPDRLLIYEVSQGWGPLCEFLGAPIPDEPMIETNTRQEFGARNA